MFNALTQAELLSADNLRNKVNKGIMGADLLLQILYVLKARPLDGALLEEILTDLQQSLPLH